MFIDLKSKKFYMFLLSYIYPVLMGNKIRYSLHRERSMLYGRIIGPFATVVFLLESTKKLPQK